MSGSNADITKRIEQLAVAQAVYKLAAAKVSTREPGNLRSEVDDHFREAFESTGAKSFDVRIGGEKVGTYSIKTTEGKRSIGLETHDPAAYRAWCEANGFVKTVIDEDAAAANFEETGEVPDGCSIAYFDTPEGAYAGSALRVDPAMVNRAIGGANVMPMLMGGEAL